MDTNGRTARENDLLLNHKHRNIVRLYGSQLTPAREKLIMEACHGSLRNFWIKNPKEEGRRSLCRAFEEWEKLWLIVQILEGVKFLHSKNVMHR